MKKIEISQQTKKREKKKHRRKIIILTIVLIILFAFKLGDMGKFKEKIKQKLEFENDNPYTEDISSIIEQEFIEIPGYSAITVSSNAPYVKLHNPESNTVYMQYTLKEGDAILYETKAIKPGNMAEVNLKELLPKGDHTISFIINTYDIDSESPCNGTTQNVVVKVK